MYSRRSRLELTPREFSTLVESSPPEVVASDFSVLVELVCGGLPIIYQLCDISTVSATSVDVVIPDDQVLDASWENATLDVTIVRRRDRTYKRLFRQPALELDDSDSEDILDFDVEVVDLVPRHTWEKVCLLDDNNEPLDSPTFHYNCCIRGARMDGMTKRLEIGLWSRLGNDLVPGTHVLRSFEILGEWV